jgi:DoxX-like family
MQDSALRFGIPWHRYRRIWFLELAAGTGVLAGLGVHPLGIAAAGAMGLLLIGALFAHLRAGDSAKDMTPALITLALVIAYLTVAITG